jgi:hypothetical protein
LDSAIDEGEAKAWQLALVKARFEERFFNPIERLLKEASKNNHNRSQSEEFLTPGFTVMAIATLLIESLASFRSGQWRTLWEDQDKRWDPKSKPANISQTWKNGENTFKHFLAVENRLDLKTENKFSKKATGRFYSGVRCGLLHQAEVTASWRILKGVKGGAIVDHRRRVIYFLPFFGALRNAFSQYLKDLLEANYNDGLWLACRYKLLGICSNAGWEMKDLNRKEIDWSHYWPNSPTK